MFEQKTPKRPNPLTFNGIGWSITILKLEASSLALLII